MVKDSQCKGVKIFMAGKVTILRAELLIHGVLAIIIAFLYRQLHETGNNSHGGNKKPAHPCKSLKVAVQESTKTIRD